MKRVRSLLQFRLRSMFLFVCVVAAFSASIGAEIARCRKEARVVEKIESLGALVQFETGILSSLTCFAGFNNPGVVVSVDFRVETIEEHLIVAGRNLPENRRDVADSDLADFQVFRGLRTIDLSYSDVTKSGLAHLSGHPSLRSLNLTGTRIDDHGVGSLAACAALQDLWLSGTGVTDSGVARLAGLKELKLLALGQAWDVPGAPVTDKCLAHVARCHRLEDLDLRGLPITDKGLAYLAGLPSLRTLSLVDTSVTPKGILSLAEIKSLRVVHITEVFTNAVRRLRLLRPDITAIYHQEEPSISNGIPVGYVQ